MCYEEYTVPRCRWCESRRGGWELTHQYYCMSYSNGNPTVDCYGRGVPLREFKEAWSVCSKDFCQQQQQVAVNRAGGDVHRAARDREHQLEEAAHRREDERIAAARQQTRLRQQERECDELARYRGGTLFLGYDEDEDFQAWLQAGYGWRG